jgi:signal peptidase
MTVTSSERNPPAATDGPGPAVTGKAVPDRATPRTRISITLALICVAVAAMAVFTLVWRLSGGSLYVVSTPSMCPSLCVGALVADRPLAHPVQVGQLVTFRPYPNTPNQIYTHRVSAVLPGGTFKTKGDAESSPDPWTVTPSEVVGVPAFTVWGLGWLYRVLPWMVAGIASLLIVRRFFSPALRVTWDRLWETALLVLPILLLQPLIRGDLLQTVEGPKQGWLTGTIVNTGLLPAQFQVGGGQFVDHVSSGHLVRLTGPRRAHNILDIHQWISLYWWGWMVVVLVVVSPLIGFFWDLRRQAVSARAVAPPAPPPASSPSPPASPSPC